MALQACSRQLVRDGPTEEVVSELRLEEQLGGNKTKGRMEVSVPRGEQQE